MRLYFIQSLHEQTDWELYDNVKEYEDSMLSHELETKESGGNITEEIRTIECDCKDVTELRDFLKQVIT